MCYMRRDLWVVGGIFVLFGVSLQVMYPMKFMGRPLVRVYEVVSRNVESLLSSVPQLL